MKFGGKLKIATPAIVAGIVLSFMTLCGCSFNPVRRGEMFEERGDYNGAMLCYEKAKMRDAQNLDAALHIARIHIKFGEYAKAAQELESAKASIRETDSLYAELCYELGYCYYEIGNSEKAIYEFEKSVQLGIDTSEAHLYLGLLYLKEKDYDLAANQMKISVDKNDNSRARYYLALSLWAQGTRQSLESAISELRIAARNETDGDWLGKYRELQDTVRQRLDEVDRRIVSLKMQDEIFPCIYEYYGSHPMGTLTLQNRSDETMYNVQVIMDFKGYGSFSQELPFRDVAPGRGEHIDVDLFARFSNKILETPPNPNQNVTVKLNYEVIDADGEKRIREEIIEGTIMLHDRNSITWKDPYTGMISAFVTQNDSSVESFTRGAISALRPLDKAIEIYSALNLHGIRYSRDASPSRGDVDRVFYPGEMLQLKRGDCDDLSALYAACLENIGVSTAFILTPGHVFIMFDTEVHLRNAPDLLLSSSYYVQVKGSRHAWLPVEVTLLGQESKGFFEAWQEGVRRYKSLAAREEIEEVIYTHDAWNDFRAVSLPGKMQPVQLPIIEQVQMVYLDTVMKIDKERELLLMDRIERYRRQLQLYPQDAGLHNSIGVAYAKIGITYGKPDSLRMAEEHFRKALLLDSQLPAPYTNLANILLLTSDRAEGLMEAERQYEEAISREEVECVYLNKMILHLAQGDKEKASESLIQALRFYNSSEVQVILGISPSDYGLVKGDEKTDGFRNVIQRLAKILSGIKTEPPPKTSNQMPGKAKQVEPEKPASDMTTQIQEAMKDLDDVLGPIVPKEPDVSLSPGGLRGTIAQFPELPMMLYWSEVQVE